MIKLVNFLGKLASLRAQFVLKPFHVSWVSQEVLFTSIQIHIDVFRNFVQVKSRNGRRIVAGFICFITSIVILLELSSSNDLAVMNEFLGGAGALVLLGVQGLSIPIGILRAQLNQLFNSFAKWIKLFHSAQLFEVLINGRICKLVHAKCAKYGRECLPIF